MLTTTKQVVVVVLKEASSPSLLEIVLISLCVLRFVRFAVAPLSPPRVSSPSLFSSLPRRFYLTCLCARRLRRVPLTALNPPPRPFLLNSPRYLLRRLQLSTRPLSTRIQTLIPTEKKQQKRIRKGDSFHRQMNTPISYTSLLEWPRNLPPLGNPMPRSNILCLHLRLHLHRLSKRKKTHSVASHPSRHQISRAFSAH